MIIEFDIGGGVKVKFDLIQIALLLSSGNKSAKKRYRGLVERQLKEMIQRQKDEMK